MIHAFEVALCNAGVLHDAAQSDMPDFEDAVIAYSARRTDCDVIDTRNIADFIRSPVPAVTPARLLEMLSDQ